MLAPATLAALQSTRAIPDRGVFYVADPISSIETRSLPTLTRSYPRRFTFYVAHPIRSIQRFGFSAFQSNSSTSHLSAVALAEMEPLNSSTYLSACQRFGVSVFARGSSAGLTYLILKGP